MLLPENEKVASELKLTQEENTQRKIDVKEKLQLYLQHHHNTKDKWLLSSHAHCFISLS